MQCFYACGVPSTASTEMKPTLSVERLESDTAPYRLAVERGDPRTKTALSSTRKCCSFSTFVSRVQGPEQVCKSEGQSHAGSRELAEGVVQHFCRRKLISGCFHHSSRNERWFVKALLTFRRIFPVLPPSLVLSVKNSVTRSAGAWFPLEVVKNPENAPDRTVRTTMDPHDATIVAADSPFKGVAIANDLQGANRKTSLTGSLGPHCRARGRKHVECTADHDLQVTGF